MATERNMTELYFEWWLEELKSRGLVLKYEREPKTFLISDPVQIFYHQVKKTKKTLVPFQLYKPLNYTPDYKVVFSEKLKNKLFGVIEKSLGVMHDSDYEEIGSAYQNTLFYTELFQASKEFPGCFDVWFDVKPPAVAVKHSGQLGSSRDFKYTSKMMYDNHGIIVNKVVPVGTKESLFGKTFMPFRYKFTDVSQSPRKLKDYERGFRDINQYLELKKIN